MHKKNFIVHFAPCSLAKRRPQPRDGGRCRRLLLFKDGDRVAILESITEPTDSYAVFIEAYTLTRYYPKWKLQFRNVGWSGDTSAFSQRGGFTNFDGIAAAEGDVRKRLVQQAVQAGLNRQRLPLEPTGVTDNIGMNDGGSTGFKSRVRCLCRCKTEIRINWLQKHPVLSHHHAQAKRTAA